MRVLSFCLVGRKLRGGSNSRSAATERMCFVAQQIIAKSRQERGIELQRERGDKFQWLTPFIWSVPGSCGEDYTVNLLRVGRPGACECEDYYYRSERDRALDIVTDHCKHIIAVEIESGIRKERARARRRQKAAGQCPPFGRSWWGCCLRLRRALRFS